MRLKIETVFAVGLLGLVVGCSSEVGPKKYDVSGTVKVDGTEVAEGEIILVRGQVVDVHGDPLANSIVEVWQACAAGRYNHPQDNNPAPLDPNFQYFARIETDKDGKYSFKSIRPGKYPGRTPHIHYAVKIKGREKFITQCYIKGHPGNAKDGVVKGIKDAKALESVMVDFAPMKNARHGELAAKFDIVLGFTPEA